MLSQLFVMINLHTDSYYVLLCRKSDNMDQQLHLRLILRLSNVFWLELASQNFDLKAPQRLFKACLFFVVQESVKVAWFPSAKVPSKPKNVNKLTI